MLDKSKRQLFNKKGNSNIVRPPWSLLETLFTDACTRCGECESHCPSDIIVKGSGGFPQVNFKIDECDNCQACLDVCPTSALNAKQPKYRHQVIINEQQCLTTSGIYCQSCKDGCDPLAIKFSYQDSAIPKPNLNQDACNQCGACISVCPSNAITITTENKDVGISRC